MSGRSSDEARDATPRRPFPPPRVEWPSLAALGVLVLVVATVVGWPMLALALQALSAEAGRSADLVATSTDAGAITPAVLARSLGWAVGGSLGGLLVGWPAGRALRRARGWPAAAWRTASMLPMVLPPWLLYAGLWLSIGPGTTVGDLLEGSDLVSAARPVLLGSVIVLWSGALASAVMQIPPMPPSNPRRLLSVDGASWWRSLSLAWREDAMRVAVALFAASLFLLSETTVFDLAQVSTVGFELRTMEALGASRASLLRGAAPVVSVLAVAILVVGVCGARMRARGTRAPGGAAPACERRLGGREGGGLLGLLVAGLLGTGAVSLVLLVLGAVASAPRRADFIELHSAALATSAAISLVSATIVGSVAVLLVLARGGVRTDAGEHQHRSIPRLAARVTRSTCAGLLLVAGLVPGALVAAALVEAYNREAFAVVYDGAAILVLAQVARLGVVGVVAAALAGAFDARPVPDGARESRLAALDAARWWQPAWRARRRLAAVGGVAAAAGFALALGELVVTSRVAPPGVPWIATDVLNAIHYQRPETVLLSLLLLVGAALVASSLLARRLRSSVRRRGAHPSATMALALASSIGAIASAVGCGSVEAPSDGADTSTGPVAPAVRVLAGAGRGPGQFNAPRVVACDPVEGTTFVIDKDARVQRFDRDGRHAAEWRMPKSDRGKPVGASIAPDGTLVVADTHEHRLVAYAPDGVVRWELGRYGMGEGEFIYPTDIAFAPDGRMFVAEYGSNDRIQVFDRERRFLYAFGSCGSAPGEFLRPQSIVYDAARDELFVADAGNHRIQVFTGDGEFRRALGGPGRAPGELHYPFGLVLEIGGAPVTTRAAGRLAERDGAARLGDPDLPRTILVAEHSNHRIQRLDAETGAPLGSVGALGVAAAAARADAPRGAGRSGYPDAMQHPWALEPAGAAPDGAPCFAVCDQGRSRIVYFTWPEPPIAAGGS